MSKALGMRCVWGLCGVLAGVFGLAAESRAEVTSDTSGSIMVYPKVVYSGGRDTVIQLSNTSNNVVYAWCFYMDASPLNGRPRWDVTDFHVVLTKQQPTHWVVSQGRQVNNNDNFRNPVQDGAGLDPGAIPPVARGFMGELKCVQTDASGTPFGGNNLKGEAVLVTETGDVSKYNGLAITANPDLASDGDPYELLLNNTVFNDGEYNSCPDTLLVDHYSDGSSACGEEDGEECPVRPYITLVPCSQDFENLIPERVTVQFEIFNEFENVFSTSTTVDCWLMTRLADLDVGTGTCSISETPCANDASCLGGTGDLCSKPASVFSYGVLGTNTALTTIQPVGLHGGVIGIGEEQHFANGGTDSAWTAWNLHQSGTRYDATIDTEGGPRVDRIRITTPF